MNRRQFLQSTLAAAVGAGMSRYVRGAEAPTDSPAPVKGSADAVIFIWLPGGVAQTDTWDPKKHTPYEKGMKGNQLLGTCPIVPTSADGIQFGAGIETMGSMMHEGAVLRSLTNETKFGAVHLKAQYYMNTGY